MVTINSYDYEKLFECRIILYYFIMYVSHRNTAYDVKGSQYIAI